MCSWGGIKFFLDGGGAALDGGDYPLMGGVPPHPPSYLEALQCHIHCQVSNPLLHILKKGFERQNKIAQSLLQLKLRDCKTNEWGRYECN